MMAALIKSPRMVFEGLNQVDGYVLMIIDSLRFSLFLFGGGSLEDNGGAYGLAVFGGKGVMSKEKFPHFSCMGQPSLVPRLT